MVAKELYDFIFSNIVDFVKISEADPVTKLILKNYFDCNFTDVIKNIEINVIKSKLINVLKDITDRLQKHEPIQYIIGKCEFLNCLIMVKKGVFIPRQETEEMVYSILKNDISRKKVIDICSGSGCIGISIKKKFPLSDVTCLDIDKNAILQSQENARLNGVLLNFLNIDIFDDKVNDIDNYDLIVSNPPYVLESERSSLDKNILFYEPELALFVKDSDPLKFYKRLRFLIDRKLNNGGSFFLEINENFANDILLLLTVENIKNLKINMDLNGKNRWISGEKYE